MNFEESRKKLENIVSGVNGLTITADTMFGDVRDIRMRFGAYKVFVTHNTVRKPSKCLIRITSEDMFAPDIYFSDGNFRLSYLYAMTIPQDLIATFRESVVRAENFCNIMGDVLQDVATCVESCHAKS